MISAPAYEEPNAAVNRQEDGDRDGGGPVAEGLDGVIHEATVTLTQTHRTPAPGVTGDLRRGGAQVGRLSTVSNGDGQATCAWLCVIANRRACAQLPSRCTSSGPDGRPLSRAQAAYAW
jgi:hypothetical protein